MQRRGLKPQARFSTLMSSWTKPNGAGPGYHKLCLPKLVLSSDFEQITELRAGLARPVLYLGLAYQRSQREAAGTALKTLTEVGLGQNVACSPRRLPISQAGGGAWGDRSAPSPPRSPFPLTQIMEPRPG